MADGIDFDFSELDSLAADLGDVPRNAGPLIRQAITGTSMGIKKHWAESLKGSRSLPALPFALSFDIKSDGHQITSEIGFDKDRNQGALGNISEFGSPTITGRGFGLKALEANQEDFQRGLEIAMEQAEREAGL